MPLQQNAILFLAFGKPLDVGSNYKMTLRIISIVTFCCAFQSSFAQTKSSFVIAETIDKGDYYYIPKSALADTVQAIHHQLKIDTRTNPNRRPIELYWISTCNDGYYNLTITPQQIFFSSSHDNPNPNFLFWVIDIDTLQFRQIKKGLQRKPAQGFEDLSKYYRQSLTVFYDNKFKDKFPIPDEWTDSILEQHDAYCDAQIKKQLTRYLSIINSYITDPSNKVVLPAGEMKPKYFGYSKNEILEWLPVKFDPPKTKDE